MPNRSLLSPLVKLNPFITILTRRTNVKNLPKCRLNDAQIAFYSSSSSPIAATQTPSSENQQQLKIEQISIPVPWGSIRGQIFGNAAMSNAKPMLCLHGYLDNSNSFKPIAPYMTKSNEFYLIALDLPGHGHSSKLPNGIPYSQKLILKAIRRCVRHLQLKNFYFFCHSYGAYMSLLYQAIFKNEVNASISFDWVAPERRKLVNIHELISKSIDRFIQEDEIEMAIQSGSQNSPHNHHHHHHRRNHKRDLSREVALEILLRANKNLDETSASILLERGLIVGEDGKLNFSRDRRAKSSLASADSFSDFVLMSNHIVKNQESPHLMIHSVPFSYGERKGEDTIIFLDRIRAEGKAPVESVFFKGTHHFHMISPKECSEICWHFLKRLKSTTQQN